MKFEQIKELVSLIDQSSLTEMEYVEEGVSLRLSKNEAPIFSHVPVATPEVNQPTQVESTLASQPIEAITEKEAVGKVITSPIVGVVYLKPNPDSDTYISQGERVSEGQVVCLIEAMKIMNEIKSEIAGEIVEILVENEQVVEYNQPLFRIV